MALASHLFLCEPSLQQSLEFQLKKLSRLIASMALFASAAHARPANEAAGPLLFVYKGGGCTVRERVPKFEQYLGRKADGVIGFNEIRSWDTMLRTARRSMGCLRDQPYLLASSVPMLVKGATLQAGARGEYDKYYAELGRIMVSAGRGDAFLRIGWEFNANWYTWCAARDPEAWVQYFRRIVKAFRSVPGSNFKIVWNPARGRQRIAPDKVYPGDDVVDVVALDLYNASDRPIDHTDPVVRWRNHVVQPYSLQWLADFGRQHRKPIAIPEWGTGTRPDGRGLGDDPLFITNMAKWIRDNNVLFHGYWDYGAKDFNANLSNGQFPNSSAAFKKAFHQKR